MKDSLPVIALIAVLPAKGGTTSKLGLRVNYFFIERQVGLDNICPLINEMII